MAFATQNNIQEGNTTRLVEEQTAKVPSIGYLGLAVGSMAVSALLAFAFRKREMANFVGLWAPSILIMGLYNKVVKVEHELQMSRGGQFGSQSMGSPTSTGIGGSTGAGIGSQF